MNKRGQVEWGTLVPGLIAFIVLIVVVVGIFWFTTRASDIGANVPSQIEVIKGTCSGLAVDRGVESYCNQIREIGKNKYVTCPYSVERESLAIEGNEQMKPLCDAQNSTYRRRLIEQCRDLKLGNKVLLDGKTCLDRLKCETTGTWTEGIDEDVCSTKTLVKDNAKINPEELVAGFVCCAPTAPTP